MTSLGSKLVKYLNNEVERQHLVNSSLDHRYLSYSVDAVNFTTYPYRFWVGKSKKKVLLKVLKKVAAKKRTFKSPQKSKVTKHRKNCETALVNVWIVENVF